jgi:hypothetical protein
LWSKTGKTGVGWHETKPRVVLVPTVTVQRSTSGLGRRAPQSPLERVSFGQVNASDFSFSMSMCGENRCLLPETPLTLAKVSSSVVFDDDGIFRPYVVPSQPHLRDPRPVLRLTYTTPAYTGIMTSDMRGVVERYLATCYKIQLARIKVGRWR